MYILHIYMQSKHEHKSTDVSIHKIQNSLMNLIQICDTKYTRFSYFSHAMQIHRQYLIAKSRVRERERARRVRVVMFSVHQNNLSLLIIILPLVTGNKNIYPYTYSLKLFFTHTLTLSHTHSLTMHHFNQPPISMGPHIHC